MLKTEADTIAKQKDCEAYKAASDSRKKWTMQMYSRLGCISGSCPISTLVTGRFLQTSDPYVILKDFHLVRPARGACQGKPWISTQLGLTPCRQWSGAVAVNRAPICCQTPMFHLAQSWASCKRRSSATWNWIIGNPMLHRAKVGIRQATHTTDLAWHAAERLSARNNDVTNCRIQIRPFELYGPHIYDPAQGGCCFCLGGP